MKFEAFEDSIPISHLPHYPLAFHDSSSHLKDRLITRGKLVLDHQDLQYREYYGAGKSGNSSLSNLVLRTHRCLKESSLIFPGYEKYCKRPAAAIRRGGRRTIFIHKASTSKKVTSPKMLERTPDSDLYVTNAARTCIEKKSRGFSYSPNHYCSLASHLTYESVRFYVEDIQPVTWKMMKPMKHLVYP